MFTIQKVLFFIVVVKSLQIDGLPVDTNVKQSIQSRSSKGRKYVPLNSLTLSRHTEAPKNEEKEDSNSNQKLSTEEGDLKQDDNSKVKIPWWQSLPPNKNKKNKVILEQYDKLKSSLPEWPWIDALNSNTDTQEPLTRKNVKDKVRVVMEKPNETSKNTNNNYEVTTPLIETAHDHMMDHAMDHSMENDNMDHNHHQMEYEIHEMEHSMDPMHHSMEHKMDPMHHSTEHKMESEDKMMDSKHGNSEIMMMTPLDKMHMEMKKKMSNPAKESMLETLHHAMDHKMDYNMDQKMDHKMNHPLDHKMDHKMDYNMDQKMDHKMDHKMNHKMDHNMDHKMNHKMDHNMDHKIDQQKMDMKKSPGLPPWLANLKPDQQASSTKISTSTSKSTTSNQPDWLANIFSSSNSQTKSTTTTEEPFKMPDFANLKTQNNRILNKDPMMKEDIPMVKINGPSITLPSFSLISDQLKLFPSSEEAEQRTASIATDEQFDLNFFPQKENMADAQARFPLLGNQNIDLGSLETTTMPVPLITQSFTPLENREALTQLVSLYEWAPTLKGEKDKTQNTKEEEKEKPIEQHMEMDKDDNKKLHNLFGLLYTSKQPPYHRYPRSPNPKLHPPKSRYPRSNAIVYPITQSEWLSGQLSRPKLITQKPDKYVPIVSTNQPKLNSGGANTIPIPDPDSYFSVLDSGSQIADEVPFQSLNSIPEPLMRELLESVLDLDPETQLTMPDLKQTLDTLATIVEDSNHDPNFISNSLSNSIKQLKTNITPTLKQPANNISIIPGIMLETNDQNRTQNNKFINSKPKTQQEHKITYSSVIQPVVIHNSSLFNTQNNISNSSNIWDSDNKSIIMNSENSYDLHNSSQPAQASTNFPPTMQSESEQNYSNLDQHHPKNQTMIVQDNPKPTTTKFPSFAVSCSKSETTNNFICRPKSSINIRGPGMNDEKEDQPTDSENNKAPMYSGGIPPSALLQPGSSGTNRPASIDKQEKAEMKQNPPFYPPDPKPQEPFPVEYQGKPKQVTAKDTLALLIQQNKDLTRLLNQQLNEQTRLLTTLMKQIKWK